MLGGAQHPQLVSKGCLGVRSTPKELAEIILDPADRSIVPSKFLKNLRQQLLALDGMWMAKGKLAEDSNFFGLPQVL